jgi:hypothetical protein
MEAKEGPSAPRELSKPLPGAEWWMGCLRCVAVVSAVAFIAALLLLLVLRGSLDQALVFRVADFLAVLLSAAGILVVLVDSHRIVAGWQLGYAQLWEEGLRPLMLREAKLVATITEGATEVRSDHPDPTSAAHFVREAPAAHAWATKLVAKLSETMKDDFPDLSLTGDLAAPTVTHPTLSSYLDAVVRSADRYNALRATTLKLRERATGDTSVHRAVFALAPYALAIGAAVALAAMVARPL